MSSNPYTVVGLVGCDFSGSTILSAVLDGLEGVQSVGETHWILDRDLHCHECCPGDNKCMWNEDCDCTFDPHCPIFTEQVLTTLHAIPEAELPDQWWPTIAKATEARVLISSDKRPSHFERLGLPDRYIFTYKDPLSHVFSRIKRVVADTDTDEIHADIVDSAIDWLTSNASFRIDFLVEQATHLAVINNENFSANPSQALDKLAGFLGVPADPAALEYWNHDHHYIGGNFSVRAKVSSPSTQHVLGKDRSYESVLNSSHREQITNDSRIQSMLERIEELANKPKAIRI